jgi:signal transduction histidine kinase
VRLRGGEHAVYVDVENSGNAIPASNLTKIFEPFFTTKPGGTGLGLAIARGIAAAHGGNLWVSTNMDGAVVFTMTVPRDALESSTGEAEDGKGSDRR